jgi:hypothetical protein
LNYSLRLPFYHSKAYKNTFLGIISKILSFFIILEKFSINYASPNKTISDDVFPETFLVETLPVNYSSFVKFDAL